MELRGGAGSGLVKGAVTLCLLAGVFVMHGLTGNHDAAMAMGHPMTPAMAPAVGGIHAHDVAAGRQHAHAGAAGVGRHHAHEVPVVAKVVAGEHRHLMGELCLAMLTGLGLAIVVALALRSLRVSRPVQLLARVSRGVAPERSPPRPPPSLSKLCVLRI
ncbi:DUF6153 family protein [Kribbella sp. NBC_01245]|uniref:DUF6153 family protein n=1 Tax=Kribbella sp. NBC_01245 TaxID=2903578 RepID=UPI002E28D954|nr:DUF6153 family protein [Kribbella sp. NBC_01245]